MITIYWNDTPMTFPSIRAAWRFVTAHAHEVGYAPLRGATASLQLEESRRARASKNARRTRSSRKDARGY